MKKVLIVVLLIALGSCLFAQDYVIGDHDLLFMPTAKTIPKGTSYFSDYELIFLNYSFGVTDRTTISAYSLFPVTDSFTETFTLSVKQNYYQYKNVNSAFWFTYVFANPFYAIGNVVSLDAKGTSLHIGLAGLGEEFSDDMGFLYMLGLKTKIGKKTDFIVEYENTDSGIEMDFDGLFFIGIRFKSKTIAWDIAGIRPMIGTADSDDSDLMFLPYLKATVFFE